MKVSGDTFRQRGGRGVTAPSDELAQELISPGLRGFLVAASGVGGRGTARLGGPAEVAVAAVALGTILASAVLSFALSTFLPLSETLACPGFGLLLVVAAAFCWRGAAQVDGADGGAVTADVLASLVADSLSSEATTGGGASSGTSRPRGDLSAAGEASPPVRMLLGPVGAAPGPLTIGGECNGLLTPRGLR